jgi:anti-sigma factor RsiW
MKACPEYESLLIDRAAGELTEADRLQVERHLAECRACSTEAAAFAKTLSAVALPARSAEERAALASLAWRTAAAWRRRERIGSLLQGAAAGVIASAAAAALILMLPARRAAANGHRTDPAIMALERWASPLPLGGDHDNLMDGLEPDFGDEGEPLK